MYMGPWRICNGRKGGVEIVRRAILQYRVGTEPVMHAMKQWRLHRHVVLWVITKQRSGMPRHLPLWLESNQNRPSKGGPCTGIVGAVEEALGSGMADSLVRPG